MIKRNSIFYRILKAVSLLLPFMVCNAHASIVLDIVDLVGPSSIKVGNSATYNLFVSGRVIPPSGAPGPALGYRIWEDDVAFDDLLVDLSDFDRKLPNFGSFSVKGSFQLIAANVQNLKGPDGESWETENEVYVKLYDGYGEVPQPLGRASLTVTITPVPLPPSVYLLGSSLLGLLVLVPRRNNKMGR